MKKVYLIILAFIWLQVHAQKQVYIPKPFATDPALSTWSYDRSAQSENFICFWGPKLGTDPSTYSDQNLRFSPAAILDTLERNYQKFVREIGFCTDGPATNLGKYKIIVVMNDTWPSGGPTGWAFGGQYDDVIGAMWVHPAATRDGGALSHELTHSLQGQNGIDKNKVGGFRTESSGFFWETHANFMRSQMYPHMLKEDMARWMATSSFHWSSTRHHYVAFNLLYTIQQIDSLGMVNRLWQESLAGEHPLMTYRRLKGWSQGDLSNFIYEYAKREVASDYSVLNAGDIIRAEKMRMKTSEPHYLWRQYTMLNRVNDSMGRYVVPSVSAPQDYGYNIIPLYTTCGNRTVKVKFKGHTEVNNTAGWRYGFVAVKADGKTARYSSVYGSNEAEVAFRMNDDEIGLYLVVVGTPTSHTSYVWEPGYPKIKRYPYELTIQNAVPEGYQENYRSEYKVNGKKHANGGGWVSNGATVAPSVYVGPNAIIRPGSNLSGNVRVEGNAWVEGATITDNVVVRGNANLFYGTYSGNVIVEDNAILNYCTVSGDAHIRDNALAWGITLGNSVVVGGDAEIGNCSTPGVYLQTPHNNNGRAACDGKGITDPSNIDVNAPVQYFTDAQMAISSPVACIGNNAVENLALIATASTSYVSPWERLGAINDGFTPASSNDKSNGAYGNWPNPNSLQWVQYDWDSMYTINKSEVYWFDDGGGVLAPTTAYMEYWNGTEWLKLGDVPLNKNAFNPVAINNVHTSKLRVSMKNATQSTGILEWRVFKTIEKVAEPYVLLSFTGQRADGANTLKWEVANEDSIANYEVTYSADGNVFTKVASIQAGAATGQAYSFTHKSNSAVSYYQLRQVATTGAVQISPKVELGIIVGNLALSAVPTTSYVSPWETLGAVNDGFTPASSSDKSNGAYGNWYSPNAIQWVQYEWPSKYVLNKSEVYWFDDRGGVQTPTTAYMEYWDGSSWIRLGDVPLAKDTFNTLQINGVVTDKVRVSMKHAVESTGILEWRVWGSAEVIMEPYNLITFSGQRADGLNSLQWSVANEDTMHVYEVEYSADSLNYLNVGTINANSHPTHQYSFSHNSSTADSYYRLRQVSKSSAVSFGPVVKMSYGKVIAFKGDFLKGNNVLQWSVQNEATLSAYEVEYSVDGITFSTIGAVAANENSTHTYQFVHKSKTKDSYYRIKLIGKDGQSSFSTTINIKSSGGQGAIVLNSNPVHDLLVLVSELDAQHKAIITIVDPMGNIVETLNSVVLPSGKWNTRVPVSKLRNGVYIVSIILDGVEEPFTVRFVKE